MTKRSILPDRPAAQPPVLPMSRAEMAALGWDEPDVLLVTGDALLDHPACGAALLARLLIAHGYRVGIVAQPRWDTAEDVAALGRPRLFAGVTAGALDSMLAHYTAFRKKRSDDAFTPGGKAGARPNRAAMVYANLVKRAFSGLPVLLGGIEASLRRAAHYDFWEDKIRRSLVLDAKADLIAYGMAERQILEATARLVTGQDLRGIPGTVRAGRRAELPEGTEAAELPSYEAIAADPKLLVPATLAIELQVHQGGPWLVQPHGDRVVLLAPPAAPLSSEEMDFLYSLPFTRKAHPGYREKIPAEAMLEASVTSHRGCGGGCSFCSLAMHQGRRISSRSRPSILEETGRLAASPGFSGSVTDVGGPSANMWQATCAKTDGTCARRSCLHPAVCPHLRADQAEQVALLRAVKKLPGVKHVRVASGLRFDLALTEPEAVAAFTAEFVGGQLKVAPEHVSAGTLKLMRKPGPEVFRKFLAAFGQASRAAGKEQYVIPYLMSAFPGCTDADMRELADFLAASGWKPQQVQCFIPTPGTVATAMFAAGTDTRGNPIPVARTDAQRLRQHGLISPQSGHGRRPQSGHGRRPQGGHGQAKPAPNKDAKPAPKKDSPKSARGEASRRDHGGKADKSGEGKGHPGKARRR